MAEKHFRIGLCRIVHEGNSFSSLEVPLAEFKNRGLYIGSDVLKYQERRDEVMGFIKSIEAADKNIELVPLLSTGGFASGNVAPEAVCYLDETLRQALREAGNLDGILFALHGAMTSASIPDLDGHFLEIIREKKGKKIPVVCTLDLHAVITRQMVDLTTAIIAYRTHPHIDLVETGIRAGNILLRILRNEINPIMTWQKIPMIFPPPDAGNQSGSLKELFDALVPWDGLEDIVACSICPCQPWLDVPELGWTVLAVTDNNSSLGHRLVKQVAAKAWNTRKNFLPEKMLSPEMAVLSAAATPGYPVIITDSADTVGGGAPGDTTTLLKTLIDFREKASGLILMHLPDPEAVQRVMIAGIGTTVTLNVGAKRDTRFSQPLAVTGKVLSVTDGVIEDVGKFGTTQFIDVGKTVCLAVDNVRLVLTEQVVIGPQPSLFRKVGVEPFKAKIVALKTGVGFKVTYGNVAKNVFRADCPGASSYNLSSFDYTHVQRPLYPLDSDLIWNVEGCA